MSKQELSLKDRDIICKYLVQARDGIDELNKIINAVYPIICGINKKTSAKKGCPCSNKKSKR